MKCPYREFKDCIVEQCPSCNYKEVKNEVIGGVAPPWMSLSEALERGIAWKETKTTYQFVSCKLIDNSVQPIPANKQVINNTTQTSVVVRKSVF